MEHGWTRRLGVFAAAVVLAGGLGAASACSASAGSIGVPAGSDFCENVKKVAVDASATGDSKRSGGADGDPFIADLQQLLASAPAEIKPDLHKLFDPLLVASGKLSPDQANLPTGVAQIEESTKHYDAYLRSHCAGSGIPGIN